MRTALILIGACMLLTGCAKYYDSLVNPETKDGVNCVASGWGWLGTPIAAHQSNQCLEQYTSAGYIPLESFIANGGNLDEIRAATIIFTANVNGASVYAGPANRNERSWVRLNGKTPWTILINNERVIKECYKAEKDGKTSNTICFDKEDHVRRVHFTFD
ncbi:hypothetical protein [uncultured Desulfovibrio sp.]|uniref:hypothetical protein n=1 Tax=uncultured Desulfovibrio sp. TaxID=167968 RepID=UPI0028044651|nr:hypothetical protein [uncultured Desulfovibrio sp.]